MFRDEDTMQAALAADAVASIQLIDRARNSVSFDGPDDQRQLVWITREYGAQIVQDYQYDLDNDFFSGQLFSPDVISNPSLDDVLDKIEAEEAWRLLGSRGENVTIAIVDTGIDGGRAEFDSRKIGGWAVARDNAPWVDWRGHGTMCACIATGSRRYGGQFDGVAPGANIISYKTRFFDAELTAIYGDLTTRARAGEHIIVTNSYGVSSGNAPPPIPAHYTFPLALEAAIAAGVCCIFSAGNNHHLTGALPNVCDPTSIWHHKCRADLMTVAACRLDGAIWYYSSRGPGQHHGVNGMAKKPDVTAPTPENGRILYGSNIQVLRDGWGTSGACPQVAGLAALLKSHRPSLAPGEIFDIIRKSTVDLGMAEECQGTGIINCKNAAQILLGA
jgi:serine protease AprX